MVPTTPLDAWFSLPYESPLFLMQHHPPRPPRPSTAPESALQKQAFVPMPGYEDHRPSTTPLGETCRERAGAAVGTSVKNPFRTSTRTRWRWRVSLTATATDAKDVTIRPPYSSSSRGGHSRQTTPASSSPAVWGYAGGGGGQGTRRQGRDRGGCPCPTASCRDCSAWKR